MAETNLVHRHYVHCADVNRFSVTEPALPELPNPTIELHEIDVASGSSSLGRAVVEP